jgi:hypothetical protein
MVEPPRKVPHQHDVGNESEDQPQQNVQNHDGAEVCHFVVLTDWLVPVVNLR